VGSALLRALEREAERQQWPRLWLVTTNDNLNAIGFYQRRGWQLVALHRNALTESRRLKPEISEIGESGIQIQHELEFEAPRAALPTQGGEEVPPSTRRERTPERRTEL
jgi:DNA-3-methyladenine glycosylase I